jgi:DNA-binding NarL/FixJ family response regulator
MPHANQPQVPTASTVSTRMSPDAARRAPTDLAVVWRRLVDGTEVVLEGYFTESDCALVLAPRDGSRPPQGWQVAVLGAVLRGTAQKRVAIELNVAPSTVAFNARLALERLGVCSRPSRVHPLLMLAASAAACGAADVPAVEAAELHEGQRLRVILVPRPDLALRGRLPKAEQEVVQQLVEGRSYAEISQERGTSLRTIANQVAGAFRRLGVSGRNELLQRLFVLSGWLPELPRAA